MSASTGCHRCGGLLVPDYSSEEYPRNPTVKCVNCGRTPSGYTSERSLPISNLRWPGPSQRVQAGRPMVKIGQPAPSFRLTAVTNGEIFYVDSARYAGRWVVICFPPLLGLMERMLLDRQAHLFAREDMALLAIAPDDLVTGEPCGRTIGTVAVPFLIDPMKRLRRLYGIRRELSPARCHTFVIDADNILRFHRVHTLTVRNMEVLRRRLTPNGLRIVPTIAMST